MRAGLPVIEASPLAELPPSERLALERRVKAALARTYFNLGVLQAQRGRFVVAGEQFEQAAGVDPEFPQVQSSLGVAYFNARKFDKATAPLGRALAATPNDAGVRRMLAMAWLNTREYEKAAELFGQDPEVGKTRPSSSPTGSPWRRAAGPRRRRRCSRGCSPRTATRPS